MTLPVTGPRRATTPRTGGAAPRPERPGDPSGAGTRRRRSGLSVPTPSTPWTAAAPLCGPMQCYRQRSPARTTRSSSSACSVPASPPRSAPSSAPLERDVVCVTGDGGCRFQHHGDADGGSREARHHHRRHGRGSWTLEEVNELDLYGQTFGTDQETSAGTSSPRVWDAMVSLSSAWKTPEPALRRAKDHARPSSFRVRPQRPRGKPSIPTAITSRFFEVYSGPNEPADETTTPL